MVLAGFRILGTALCFIGWIGTIVVCALPQWKVTVFIGQNIVTAQAFFEGIWKSCVMQSTGQMQCKVYDPMLALSNDLQAARPLIIIAILVGSTGLLLAFVEKGVGAGVVLIIAGVMCLTPVCWTAHTIIRDFNNPIIMGFQKRELGAALFIGWGAAGLLIIGGALLCANCPRNDNYSAKYSAAVQQDQKTTSEDRPDQRLRDT